MGWYSLLPPYLTVIETWIIRIAVRYVLILVENTQILLRVDNLSGNQTNYVDASRYSVPLSTCPHGFLPS